MPRALHKLSDVALKAAWKPGRHSDGGGLYLNVSPTSTKSWLFLWTRAGGKRREMGLGAYPAVSLAKARGKASELRAAVAEGRDPIAERNQAPEPTFGACADLFLASVESEWRNEKHRWQWEQTLRDRCATIRDKRVSQISTEDVLQVLKPMWADRHETAARLRGRIERVLNFAKVKGWRTGENPAAWRDNLSNLLPKRPRLSRGHHSAMVYADVPSFLSALRGIDNISARALEFTILTVARSGETIGASVAEIDLAKKLWRVPAERMKAGELHEVPLVGRALDIARIQVESSTGPYLFPSSAAASDTKQRPLSNMAMMMQLRRLVGTGVTVHGFRSAFRDWCGDATNFPREVAEAALAHRIGNLVEQAYRRGTALEKRRKLMEAWVGFCSGTTEKRNPAKSNVIPMRAGG